MRKPQEILTENLMACFEGLGLSPDKLNLIEDYLEGSGYASEDFDLGIAPDGTINMVDTRYKGYKERFYKCFSKLHEKHKDDGLYSRFFDIAFQIFGVSINEGLSYNSSSGLGIKAYQGVAVTAHRATNTNWVYPNGYKNVSNALKNNNGKAEDLLRAIEYTGNSAALLIYAVLFSGGENDELGRVSFSKEHEGAVEKILGLFSKKSQEIKRVRPETSHEMIKYVAEFKKYVKLCVGNAHNIFYPALSDAERKQFEDYALNESAFEEELPDAIKTLLSQRSLNENISRYMLPVIALNYRKSAVLANILRAAMYHSAARCTDVFDRAGFSNADTKAICWYYDLMPDLVPYILFLGSHHYEKALIFLAEREPESYIKALRSAPVNDYSYLVKVAGKIPSSVYKQHYQGLVDSSQNDLRDKIIAELKAGAIAKDGTDLALLSEQVLKGEKPLSDTYPYIAEIAEGGWRNHTDILGSYSNVYGEDDFIARCYGYLAVRGNTSSLTIYARQNGDYRKTDYRRVLNIFERAGLDEGIQYDAFMKIYDDSYGSTKDLVIEVVEKKYKKLLAEDTTKALDIFKNSSASGRVEGVALIDESSIDSKKDALLEYIGDGSKQVRAELLSRLEKHKEWGQDYVLLLSSKKAPIREAAALLLAKCPGDYIEALSAALEKEKNAKAMAAISEAIAPGSAAAGKKAKSAAAAVLSLDDLVNNLHKGGKKRSLAWLYEGDAFPEVHFDKDGEKGEIAGEEYLQAILIAYSSMSVAGVNSEARTLAQQLDKNELAAFMEEVYDRFIKNGAEAKKKWVLYAAGIHGGARIVPVLKHQIDEWAAAQRGAIAAEAIKALALNDSPTALLIVDQTARKYKFKQVRKAAGDALKFAAEQLGLSVEELSDRIVPDLDFDDKGERVFDYGSRSFTVRITPALDMIIKNSEGKQVKSMPAPGKNDDEAKAAESYAQFKEMKAQMRTVVKNQSQRLEAALSSGRLWSKENWEKLFVKNPIMHQFAISLIWGVYKIEKADGSVAGEHESGIGTPIDTFRYMEDGSFNTVNEDEYELPDGARIGLVHPVELAADEIDAWKEQLEDYEIKQVFPQLSRPIFLIEENEKKERKLERFNGSSLADITLTGRLVNLGWEKGPALDAGMFELFYREDRDAGLGVELDFSGAYIGGGYDYSEDVEVYNAAFYRLADYDRTSVYYDHIKEEKTLRLDDVPARYFSEIVYQLKKATAVNS